MRCLGRARIVVPFAACLALSAVAGCGGAGSRSDAVPQAGNEASGAGATAGSSAAATAGAGAAGASTPGLSGGAAGRNTVAGDSGNSGGSGADADPFTPPPGGGAPDAGDALGHAAGSDSTPDAATTDRADASVVVPADAAVADPAALPRQAAVVPPAGWDCGMPGGIPALSGAPPRFSISAELGETHDVGVTPHGTRRLLELRAGSVEAADASSELSGSLWSGGFDYELTLDNGVVELEQITILHLGAADEPVLMRACGLAASREGEARMVFDFEADTAGSFASLNDGVFIGTRTLDGSDRLRMQIFELDGAPLDPSAQGDAVTLEAPVGQGNPPWDCVPASGTPGDVLYSSDVAIADGLILVGNAKRGTRNVIPITGGTASGMPNGSVLRGGADFQLLRPDGELFLDARYVLRADDGTLALVRNCGTLGALAPTFETAVDGSLSFLNEGLYRSDDPGIGLGSVHIVVRRAR